MSRLAKMTNALYEESEMKRVYCIVVVISALLVLCTGCGSPSIQDAGSAILPLRRWAAG